MQAAATGISPEKSVARSAPIRCMPMYQHTKPTTVTTAACHSSAAASAASGTPQPRGAVAGAVRATADSTAATAADGGGQQPWPERPQHRHGEHREADLTGQRAHGEGDARPVRTAPALDGEGAEGDERRAPYRTRRSGSASVQQRHENGHDDRRAAHEDAGDGRFRGAFGGEHGEVEADHADGREQRETRPLAGVERAAAGRGAAPAERAASSRTQARP